MTAPTPSNGENRADDAAESRELSDYLAGQNPLDAEAALWAARKQDGLSAEDEAELQSWLAGDPARAARLGQLEGLMGQLDELPPDDVATLKAAVGPASVATDPEPGHAPPARSGRRSWRAGWGRLVPTLAMAGLATLVVGGGWMGWDHWQQQPTFTQSFASVRGQQLSATLPDGSHLRLDTATRLDVALYRQRREVQLPQGQALFEVQADAARPFHVMAGPLRITVLGTRFSVRYTQDATEAGRVRVVVEEGRVRVARADGQGTAAVELRAIEAEALILTAGQAVEADAQGHIAAITAASLPTATAWREGRVVLNDTPLGIAVAEFERYVDTGLVIPDPTVAALRLNGSFDLRQVQAFKRALPQALPVRLLTRADGQTEVMAAN